MIRSLDITRALRRYLSSGGSGCQGNNCSFIHLPNMSATRRGFTLMEIVVCLIIVMMAGIGTMGAITYTRLNLELEKQRLAALNYCRQAMEAIQSLDTAKQGTKPLVPFNRPGIEDLKAEVKVEYYDLKDDGSVNLSSSPTELPVNRPVYARVSVSWVPHGSVNRSQSVVMSTIVTRGID